MRGMIAVTTLLCLILFGCGGGSEGQGSDRQTVGPTALDSVARYSIPDVDPTIYTGVEKLAWEQGDSIGIYSGFRTFMSDVLIPHVDDINKKVLAGITTSNIPAVEQANIELSSKLGECTPVYEDGTLKSVYGVPFPNGAYSSCIINVMLPMQDGTHLKVLLLHDRPNQKRVELFGDGENGTQVVSWGYTIDNSFYSFGAVRVNQDPFYTDTTKCTFDDFIHESELPDCYALHIPANQLINQVLEDVIR